jgi:CRISPR-associated endoribonuclease Cas6
MRFSVSYKLSQLDQSYRMRVYSLIKQAIRLENSQYYYQLFVQAENKMKNFSYSTYLHNFSLDGTTIHLDQITITISSPDMEFAVYCFNGLRKLKEYKVDSDVWIQSKLQLLNERTISNRKVVFQTISSVLIEDKEGNPLSPSDPNYESEINYYANLQIQQFANRNLYEKLKFTPIRMRKVVVKERNRHMKTNDYLYFTTYRGSFLLEGNPQDLQLLYQLGLGKRTTYFGLLDYQGEGV